MKKTTIFFLTCIFILLLPENVLAASPLYIWPTESHSLSRNFNEHSKKAIDISVSSGELVYASRSGKVINVFTGCNNHSGIKNGTCEKRGLCNPSSASYNSSGFCNSGFGNGLIIKHDDGTYAHYAHMSTVHVSEGQTVKQGDVVGTSGDSGNCNGPCLHFELRSKNVSAYKGTPIDPLTVFNNEPSISVLTKDAKSISEDSATLYGSVSATGINVTEVGMYFGKSESNLAKLGSDTVNTYSTNMWYNTTKYGKILEPGSTYYYRAYAIAGGKTYYGSIKTFSTLPGANTVSGSIGLSQSALTIQDNVCCSLTATVSPAGQKVTWKSSDSSVATVKDGMVSGVRAGTATITASMTYNGVTYSATCKVTVTSSEASSTVSVTASGASEITANSVRLDGSCSYTGTRPSSVGVYMGTSSSNMTKWGSDSINHNKNPFDIWYNLSGLSAGTTYYYKFYAIVNGKEVVSSTKSFTTKNAEASSTASVTVSGASNITASSVRLDGSCSYTGTRPSSVGVYMGTSSGNMTKWGSDNINHNKNPFDIWYNLSGLSAGTTYYYKFYAIVNGKEVVSSTKSFTTKNAEASSTASVTASGASNITASSVRLDGSCSYTGTRPSSVGVYMGTSSSNMTKWGSDNINHNKNPFDIWYNLSGLSAGTTYYYKFYAIVNGKEVVSSTKNFTTKNAEASSTASVTVSGASNITANSVRLDGSCSYTGTRPSSVGVYMGTSSSNMTKWGSDSINHNKNPFDIWYNLSGLTAGTTYYYKFYAIVDGKEVVSSTKNFTTTAVSTENVRIGIVSGTGSSYLAINDAPASSSSGQSTQIGRIPPGGTCTVYLNKTSGNWYWVEYNGVSGYVYSKYITLQ